MNFKCRMCLPSYKEIYHGAAEVSEISFFSWNDECHSWTASQVLQMHNEDHGVLGTSISNVTSHILGTSVSLDCVLIYMNEADGVVFAAFVGSWRAGRGLRLPNIKLKRIYIFLPKRENNLIWRFSLVSEVEQSSPLQRIISNLREVRQTKDSRLCRACN